MLLLRLAIWSFAIISLRGLRWAYVTFILLSLLYFPANVGFHLHPRACQIGFDLPLAIESLRNYAHIIMFGVFFLITTAQFRTSTTRTMLVKAGLLSIMMGALVEIGEGITGARNCRARDLIPDAAGALAGAAIVSAWRRRPLRGSAKVPR